MTCSTPCQDFQTRQGRCECGTNASRAALGLRLLTTRNGGETVHFPSEEDDVPLVTPEGSVWSVVQGVLAFIAVAFLALAAVALRSKGAM